jgi:hypothetical protein
MSRLVWALPVPSTSLMQAPILHRLPNRTSRLILIREAASADGYARIDLTFTGVVATTCAYADALPPEASDAYDKLVLFEQSTLLARTGEALRRRGRDVGALLHYAIAFDDGPYYEFVCHGCSIVERALPTYDAPLCLVLTTTIEAGY